MEQLKAYKFRFYPNKIQIELLAQTFGCARFIWNQRVADFLNRKPDQSYSKDLSIKEMKLEHSWLADVPYNALEQKLQDWVQLKKQFFNKKRKKKLGRPKFKKRTSNQSFRLSQNGFSFKIKDDKQVLKVAKIGVLNVHFDRDIPQDAKIKNVTISKNACNQYFVSILVKQEIQPKPKPKTSRVVGIDLGLNHLLITSDGHKFENPRFFRKSQAKLAKAQKHLSRKTKGSIRYHKQKLKVAKIHQKIVNQRKHYNNQISNFLVQNYDVICSEDLAISNMIKNHKLAKSIQYASWNSLISMIDYKSKWHDRVFFKNDRFFASSKTCHSCGNIVQLDLSDREWVCEHCGVIHDRDINAAKNLIQKGLLSLKSISVEYLEYMRGENVRPDVNSNLANFCETHSL